MKPFSAKRPFSTSERLFIDNCSYLAFRLASLVALLTALYAAHLVLKKADEISHPIAPVKFITEDSDEY
jgi:hypothetical protein